MSGGDVVGITIVNGKVLSLVDGHRAQLFGGLDASKSTSPSRGDAYMAYDTNKEYICFTNGSWTYVPKYQVGLDASKSASPVVGDIYKATDTLREYVCLVAGTWSFVPQSQVGLDASKTATPIVGEGYNATDTGKSYQCFVTGVWSLTYSPCYEEYSNHLGTVDNFTGLTFSGTGSGTTDAVNHKMNLSTGTGGGGLAEYHINRYLEPATECFELNYIINDIVLGDGSERLFELGLSQNNCVARFEISSGGVSRCKTLANGVFKSTAISNLVNGDKLTIKNYKILVLFYVNGYLVASHLDTPFIAGLIAQPAANVFIAVSTVATTMSIDYIGLKVFK